MVMVAPSMNRNIIRNDF